MRMIAAAWSEFSNGFGTKDSETGGRFGISLPLQLSLVANDS
jgi:hypothetical protein